MREKFKQQLEEMYRQMVIMGSLCQQAIAVAVRTLDEEEDRAEKLEAQVFAVDGEIDDMEREIEALCTKLLLKQQPVAADLRRITAALKMVTDLERIRGPGLGHCGAGPVYSQGASAQPPETDGGGGHPDGQRERGPPLSGWIWTRPGRSLPTTMWWTGGLIRLKKNWFPRLPRTAPLGRNCWMSSWWPNIWSGLAIMPPTWRSGWSTR